MQNRSGMWKYAGQYPESSFAGNYCTEYGFRADTGNHSFLIRCNPTPGDYNFYCYCYVTKWLDQHLRNAKKGIRFIDEHYNELFRIADGEKIVITDSLGKTEERTCRYIDEYHTEIGSQIYHICQFAELMKGMGSAYEAKERKEQMGKESDIKDTKDSFLIYHSEHCGDIEVKLDIQQYFNNDRIAICLMSFEDGYLEPVGDLTIDIDAPAPIYCGYLDTGGLFNAEKFVIDNGLGEFTGLTGRSGYREFPLYLFNADKLRELCPEQMAVYERSIGVVSKEAEKKKSR